MVLVLEIAFPHFRLVKTTHIIHHNQLLLTKFGKNFFILNQWLQKFCHIEPMISKWRQKGSPQKVLEPLTKETWGWGCVIFGKQKNKRQTGKTPLRIMGKYFEWIMKQLLNSAFVGYEEFCRSWRALSTSVFSLSG